MERAINTARLIEAANTTACDREPIHVPGSIQPFGFLVAFASNWAAVSISENAGTWLGFPASEAIDLLMADIFRADAVHDIRGRIQVIRDTSRVERIFGLPLLADGTLFDVAIHMSGGLIIVEAEPSSVDGKNSGHLVQSLVERLQQKTDLQTFCHEATRHVRALTGFERVMLYRFNHDGSGEVVAESATSGLAPYLGLHYPASDIPQQARRLYERNWLRVISDVDAVPARILARPGQNLPPLDLSMSVLRAVSPVHLEYLRNMRVAASLSVSVMRGGKLWGLLACHHSEPRQLGFESRSATELYGQIFSWILESREREVEFRYEADARVAHAQLVSEIAIKCSSTADLAAVLPDLARIVRSDGAAVVISGKPTSCGTTPDEGQVVALGRWLESRGETRLFRSSGLADAFEAAREHTETASGMMAIPISRVPGDYLLYFRREAARPVKWAGEPRKVAVPTVDGERLNPRKSFEAWQETVRGQSVPWSEADVRIAEGLRTTILDVILRTTAAADQDRRATQAHQELLIAELNHRVRNILNLIRALVTQSRAGSETLEDFAAVIGGRIQALARAHDQITARSWGPSSLHELIRLEAAAYLGVKAGRVEIIGDDVLLEPQAFSTLALVFHEMMTNSAKYGALADSHGSITIILDRYPQGSLVIDWQESGGPPVQAPTRRGFGTTIIERSIPYELKGEAEIQYLLAGVKATFIVPGHFLRVSKTPPAFVATWLAESCRVERPLSGKVLLVEDNLIIALESEDMLMCLGAASVETASSVRDALRLIQTETPVFAVLDMNLGSETSLPVAKCLLELGIPFVFATGYGEDLGIPANMVDVPVLKKPFDLPMLRAVVAPLVGSKPLPDAA